LSNTGFEPVAIELLFFLECIAFGGLLMMQSGGRGRKGRSRTPLRGRKTNEAGSEDGWEEGDETGEGNENEDSEDGWEEVDETREGNENECEIKWALQEVNTYPQNGNLSRSAV
jgi:hypothetical protein